MNRLRTEADLLRTQQAGTYTLPELYQRARKVGLADRPSGRRLIQDGQEQYKRRVRAALQTLKRQGRARRVSDGQAAWLIEGDVQRPRRALFVWLPADPSQVELVLGDAADILARAEEPIDLIVADPPWALGRADHGAAYRRTYGRRHTQVVDGYVEVDPDHYGEFTASVDRRIRGRAAARWLPGGGHRRPAGRPGAGRRRRPGRADLRQLGRRCPPVRPVHHPPVRAPALPHHAADQRGAGQPAAHLLPAGGDAPRPYRADLRTRRVDRPARGAPGRAAALRQRPPGGVGLPGDPVDHRSGQPGLRSVPRLGHHRRGLPARRSPLLRRRSQPHSLRFAMGRVLAELVPLLGARFEQPALFDLPAEGPA